MIGAFFLTLFCLGGIYVVWALLMTRSLRHRCKHRKQWQYLSLPGSFPTFDKLFRGSVKPCRSRSVSTFLQTFLFTLGFLRSYTERLYMFYLVRLQLLQCRIGRQRKKSRSPFSEMTTRVGGGSTTEAFAPVISPASECFWPNGKWPR